MAGFRVDLRERDRSDHCIRMPSFGRFFQELNNCLGHLPGEDSATGVTEMGIILVLHLGESSL